MPIPEDIVNHVNKIKMALESDDADAAFITYLEFGLFLQKEFPGESFSIIQGKKTILEAKNSRLLKSLPPLELHALISSAKTTISMNLRDDASEGCATYQTAVLDAFNKGLSIFETIMGDQATKKIVKIDRASNTNPRLGLVKKVIEMNLNKITPENVKDEEVKKETVDAAIQNIDEPMTRIKQDFLHKKCESYSRYLEKLIKAEVRKKPKIFATILQGKEVLKELDAIKENEKVSSPIKQAIEKYQAVKALQAIIPNLSHQNPPDQRTIATINQYQTTLQKHRDTATKTFLKICATIFTFGILTKKIWQIKGGELVKDFKPFLLFGHKKQTGPASISKKLRDEQIPLLTKADGVNKKITSGKN